MVLSHSKLISGPGCSSFSSEGDGGSMPGLGRTQGTSVMLESALSAIAGLEMLMCQSSIFNPITVGLAISTTAVRW